jgi:hypothetical protein
VAAPRDIVDALESVISVYFSGCRHNLRSAFILCDGLIELTCKAKAESSGWHPVQINFTPLLKLAQVALDPATVPLGKRCEDSHKVRNKMHHVNAAATVDARRCADAITDAVACIDHCFPNASNDFADALKIALRVVRLLSSLGNGQHQTDFTNKMNDYRWRTQANDRKPRTDEYIIKPGLRRHWSIVIFDSAPDIETILNEIGAP